MRYILYKKGLIYNGAPHLEQQLSKKKMRNLLRKSKAFLIRNVYNFDCHKETSFWYIIKDSFNGFEELSSKTRQQIRRAQKLLDIKIIDKQVIIDQGYEVYLNSFNKYKNIIGKPASKESFIKNLQIPRPGEQFWGCFDRNNAKLVAYFHNSVQENMCHYYSMKALSEYLTGYYPYHGLIYSMNEYYFKTLG
jgi:hypothetical protein